MILIADDSKFMRSYLKQALQKQGYRNFVEATNGEEAITLYRLIKPELVLLDITMPKIDGLTALKEIMGINPEAKVIMCSALSTNANMTEALRLGASDFVVKPFFEEINKVIGKILTGGHQLESIIF